MRLWGWCTLCALTLVLSQQFHSCHAQLRVEAVFNQRGVRGSVQFYQESPDSSTMISVNLTGMYM